MKTHDVCICHYPPDQKHQSITTGKNEALLIALSERIAKSCAQCQSDMSPIWWTRKDVFGTDEESSDFFCQSCMWDLKDKQLHETEQVLR